uniref:Uncharacterized protein n=1 Tax=Anguilla anguilla TaxID=7936 RepID=A0A0E9RDH6_ANGAN
MFYTWALTASICLRLQCFTICDAELWTYEDALSPVRW